MSDKTFTPTDVGDFTLGVKNMTENIWDPLNKAAALVTLMTGAPAFLVFIGLPTVAAVVLGLFSITSLLFALIRSRFLQNRAARLLELHAADNKLLQSFNSTISGSNRVGETQVSDIRSLISEALQTLRLYVEADVGCEAKVAIKLFSTGDEVLVHTFASTGSDNFSQHRFTLKQGSGINAAFSNGNPIFLDTPRLVWNKYRNFDYTSDFPKTVAIFPILVKTERNHEQAETMGVLTVDLKNQKILSTELQSVLLKYSHLFFLLFTQIRFSLDQVTAQPGAPEGRSAGKPASHP